MKRNSAKKSLAVLLAALMAAALLAGFGGSATASTAATPLPPEDVTFYLWGDTPNQMDDVVSQFESLTKDTLNMTIHMDFTPLADYPSKIQLRLSAGESVDACYDAQWMNLMNFIANGDYTDLTGYFGNDQYPGLKAAFDQNYLNNNMLGTGKIYAIPFTQSYGTAPLVYIRGDLRQKYGCPVVDSLQTYEQYLDAIVTNEPNMVPYASSPSTYNVASIYNDVHALDGSAAQDMGVFTWRYVAPNVYADLYVQNYQVISCAFHEEGAAALAAFPAPYNQRDLGVATMSRDFYDKGYIDKDFLNVQDARGDFTSGKAASIYWDTSNYTATLNALIQSVPDAQMETWCPNPAFAQGMTGKVEGKYAAWNFMCIPTTTPQDKVDRIMMFYDWMFSSPENHDLFELGIEGKNFELTPDGEYKIPDGVDPTTNYNLNGYQFTWNPNFVRLSADIPADVRQYTETGNNPATYYDSLFSGFTFQPDSVQNELANPDFATVNSQMQNIEYGLVADPADAYAAIDAQTVANKNLQDDIATVKAEFVKQAQAYLDQRKIQDQTNGAAD